MIAQKTKPKTILTVILIAAAVAAVCTAAYFTFCAVRLNLAVKNLDVSDELSVIRLMKIRGDNPDTVKLIAGRYTEKSEYAKAAKFLLYALQYLSPDDSELYSMLRDSYAHSGAPDIFTDAQSPPAFEIEDFEPSTYFEGIGYGIAGGVYTVFCGGYAKAKISSLLPLSVSACPSGVYILDSIDHRLKLLSEDGASLKIVSDVRMNEFLYSGGKLYFIDENGIPQCDGKSVSLQNGAVAADIRVENDAVVCTVYDKNYSKIKDITLS